MNAWRRRAEQQLRRQRLLTLLCGSGLGGSAMALLALADGRAMLPAFALGGFLSSLYLLRKQPLRADPAHAIEPSADPDGLLRTLLVLPAADRWEPLLATRAQGRSLRFRSHPELRPLAVFLVAAIILALWIESAPAQPHGSAPDSESSATAASSDSDRSSRDEEGPGDGPPADPSRTAADPQDEAAADPPPRPSGAEAGRTEPGSEENRAESDPVPSSAGVSEAPQWQPVPVRTLPSTALQSAKDFGPYQPYVERFLRLRSKEEK